MSEQKWTNEQLNAIDIIEKNLLVSAGAGSGKTAVLVERIIKRISNKENPIDIDRLLVMTFTNAAAYEMKERIRNSLYLKIKENPDNQNLSRQLLLLNRAVINTIHSFCKEVIRSNYNLVDIDPAFEICDETKSEQYKKMAMEKVLIEFYEKKDKEFINLINMYGLGNDDKKIVQLVFNIHKYIMSTPNPKKWLDEKLNYYIIEDEDFFNSMWGNEIRSYITLEIEGVYAQLNKALSIIDENEVYSGYYETLLLDLELIKVLESNASNETWNQFKDTIDTIVFSRLKRNKKEADKTINELIKDIRNKIKKEIADIKAIFINDSNEQKYIIGKIGPVLNQLNKVVLEFKSSYEQIKKKNGVLDFNDLEHYCLYCLKNGASPYYKEKFIEILVDEYQDSNLVQEEIINLIKQENNLFLVGDVKQSIYKFRNANPQLFIDKYKQYKSEKKENNDIKIELNKNFRSRKEIIDFINFIFNKIMSEQVGDIEYNKGQLLNYGASYSIEDVPCEILIAHGNENIFDINDSKITYEAAMIAAKINNIINSEMEIFDKTNNTYRKVQYSDIVILLRSIKGITNEFVTTFKKYDIPIYGDETNNFFENDDISRVISFLEVMDNPYQDIPFLSIMTSSLFNFTNEELAVIKANSNKYYFYEKVVEYKNEDIIKNKIDKMLNMIKEYRDLSSIISIDTLIWKLITDTGYYYYHINSKYLNVKQKNLRRLFEIAGQFIKYNNSNIFLFLQYIKQHKEGTSDLVGAKNYSENDNIVKIMSIHKSKGLEFPIVFVSNCTKQFNNKDSKDAIILHRELGFGPEFVDIDKNFKFSTVQKQIISKKIKIENISEEMRILYVALTRAREKLYITGYVKEIEKACLKWSFLGIGNSKKLSASNILHANSYIDWIMSVLSTSTMGKSITEYAGLIRDSYLASTAKFEISFIETIDIDIIDNDDKAIKRNIIISDISYDDIKRKFEWKYMHTNEVNLYRKISVTELKKYKEREKAEEVNDIFENELIEKPEFMYGNKGVNAAKRGTMVHNLMAYLEFDKIDNDDYIKEAMKDMNLEDSLLEAIKQFFKSEIGKRLLKSKEVYREKSFMLPISTISIYPELKDKISSEHKTLVQGVIDCMFIEDNQVIIIDYKTDYVLENKEYIKAKQYQIQLDTYKTAVENILNKKVKEKIIYFFHNGKTVNI